MAMRRMPPPNSSRARPPPASSSQSSKRQLVRSATTDSDTADIFPQQPEASTSALPPLSLASPSKKMGRLPDAREEMNVQVVVRCRVRSEREIAENSTIIVSTQGACSEEITIETASPTSNLGITNLPPTRTYPFDRVYGPEADQAMIYNDVLQPVLEEVLAGYNCTVFAYGQTGTGKTHTMQGDLTPSVTGGPCADAGMIPRVLSKLYQHLESSVSDYSVKIAYVELYNEELRDLLASELSAPMGLMQPMGHAGNVAGNTGLKIFDEAGAGKKGVLIQGLEEVSAKDFNHAIGLLRKGSHRRQIAATKFNEHSSRSHSIFTVTIHTKETSAKGDDTLRVGKLNLVDLAGSENIGRSGAENKRAREAGMINQSLLTLGRVINALVDQSSHVPYRESKLTRLLQDSLGGRTKTCIIATISPARSNMEETLSTLDYAIRAKSIRNRPEINQRMTRNSLLKEYVGEIEKLKSDLIAAREKNGIWFSKESWAEMSGEQEQLKTLHEEAKRSVDIIGSQMRAVREEFEQSMGLLLKSEHELKVVKGDLERTEVRLKVCEDVLGETKTLLEEEVVVREAHQRTEHQLNDIAHKLKNTAEESVGDVQSLFGKLDRKTNAFTSNTQAVARHGKALDNYASRLDGTFGAFVEEHQKRAEELRRKAEEIQRTEVSILNRHSTFITSQLDRLAQSTEAIRARDQTESGLLENLTAELHETIGSITSMFGKWEGELKGSCEDLTRDIGSACVAGVEESSRASNAVYGLLNSVIHDAQAFVQSERKAMSEVVAISDKAASAEIDRLRNQNTLLTQLLDSEKVKAESMRDSLITQVTTLLVGFTDQRDSSMRQAITSVRADIAQGQQEMAFVADRATEARSSAEARYNVVETSLREKEAEGQVLNERNAGALNSISVTVEEGLGALNTGVSGALNEQASVLGKRTAALRDSVTSSVDQLDRSKRTRVELTTVLESDTRDSYNELRQNAANIAERLQNGTKGLIDGTGHLAHVAGDAFTSASTCVAKVKEATDRLIKEGTKEDLSTGSTPRKRQWVIEGRWALTKAREEILREWRESQGKENGVPMIDVDEEDEMPVEEPSPYLSTSSSTAVSSRDDLPTEVVQHVPERKRTASLMSQPKPLKERSSNVGPTAGGGGAIGKKRFLGARYTSQNPNQIV